MTDTLSELRRLYAEATQGPGDKWYVGGNGRDVLVFDEALDRGQLIATVASYVYSEGRTSDKTAALIVAMHAALPKLLEIAEACGELLKAIDAGRVRQAVGVTGQTIDAQLRASVYERVPAWPVELAREKYALALASLKEPAQ